MTNYDKWEKLTKKQVEVVTYYCEYGYSKKDICKVMHIELTTVNQHFADIRLKWGVHSLVEITRYYFKYYKPSLEYNNF